MHAEVDSSPISILKVVSVKSSDSDLIKWHSRRMPVPATGLHQTKINRFHQVRHLILSQTLERPYYSEYHLFKSTYLGITPELLKMSFRDLRASRQTKQTRSFVKPKAALSSDAGTTSQSTISTEAGPSEQAQLIYAGSYPLIPETLEIRKFTETGRGIYTKQGFEPGMSMCSNHAFMLGFTSSTGSILISIKPHVTALSTPYLDSYCSSCSGLASTTGLKRCTRCRTVRYCGTVCTSNLPQ